MTLRAYPLGTPVASYAAAVGNCTPVDAVASLIGNAQGTFIVPSDLVIITNASASHKAVTLPDPTKVMLVPGDFVTIINANSGQTISVFPPTGGNISNAGVNTGATVAANKTSAFIYCTGITSSIWTVLAGA